MNLIVGVTGGIGSGKSAATTRFEHHGITVVDADLASRVIVEPGRPALANIADHFGPNILFADGSIDRAALRQRVFADPEQRKWLEQLTHPLIGEEIFRQLESSSSPYTILSSPLLFETTQKDLCSEVVLIDVPEDIQLSRTMSRDSNDESQVRRIMAVQMSRQDRLSLADHTVDNSGSLNQLHAHIDSLHQQFLEISND